MNRKFIFTLLTAMVFFTLIAGHAKAEVFTVEGHIGYGSLDYEEENSGIEGESEHNILLLGISGEYSITDAIYAGLYADWGFADDDTEEWSVAQTNDLDVFVQYYDLRLGYKSRIDDFQWKVYISGGWDGLNVDKDNYVVNGLPLAFPAVEQDLSLWRVGGGLSARLMIDRFAVDGLFAYSRYIEGDGEISTMQNIDLDAEGNRWDGEVGVSYEIVDNLSVRLGGQYTFIDLSESDAVTGPGWFTIFPRVEVQTISGNLGVNYSF
ncbi:hypothetical protein BMS3Abin10_00102 [bacterium BMS3Abin10]|nr:hypothetical protein BMS3Abin10_00102 [bacterium BMS3Abin10]